MRKLLLTPLKRRTFLKGLLMSTGAAAGGGVGCDNPPGPVDLPSTDHVLVIGAGMAGLAAAADLHSRGISVEVIEGRERVGGRTWTTELGGHKIDLGASWIHGVTGNPIADLAWENDIETVETDYDLVSTFGSDGTHLTEDERDELDDLFDTLMDEVSGLSDERQRQDLPDISLGEAITTVLAGWSLTSEETVRLNMIINTTLEHEFAASVDELSLYEWDEGGYYLGGDVIFPEGYQQILDLLTPGLKITTGAEVRNIRWGSDGVTVSTSAGDFVGDRAIITVPLGVLQAGKIEFDPPLSSARQTAITRLGMGLLNKSYLQFERAFWTTQEQVFIDYADTHMGFWAESLDLAYLLDVPILLMFNAADYGRSLEDRSDEDIVAEAMGVLRKLYGQDIPDPISHRITRWASDPFSLGSYSYLAPGSSPDDRDGLAYPEGDRLFFAGEATYKDYPSTVHGAYLSGLREAERWLSGDNKARPGKPLLRRHISRRAMARKHKGRPG